MNNRTIKFFLLGILCLISINLGYRLLYINGNIILNLIGLLLAPMFLGFLIGYIFPKFAYLLGMRDQINDLIRKAELKEKKKKK